MVFNLETAIVRIVAPNGSTVGTGFVLTDDGLIATCAHVIADVGIGPGETVNFVFHCTGEEGQAVVEVDWWRETEAEDIAILKLIGELPEPVKPLPLGTSTGAANHSFETIGFPLTNPTGGILGSGTILGQTKINERPVLQLRSQEVTGGFSGAPVWDTAMRQVVGMVTATADPDGRWRLAETAFITPTETLRLVCTDLQLTDICPYRSLEPFTETDADFFFGRSRLVEKLLVRLKSSPRFLAVLGPSGSGKSSLVRAGIIPAIRQGHVPGSDRWRDITITPSDNPFRQLETKGLVVTDQDLTRGVHQWQIQHSQYERLMLVIDQFEELFTLCPDSILRAFVSQLTALLDGVWPVTVILTLRSDFYSYLTEKATSLLPWLEQSIVNIPLTLSRSELVEMVQAPAEQMKLHFEQGLVDTIVQMTLDPNLSDGEAEVGRNTMLPLLEFALTQLWERRYEGVLTHRAYQTLGGVTGALNRWADQAYYQLNSHQHRLARRIFTDLVYLGDEEKGLPTSRQRRSLTELCRQPEERETVHNLVRHFADARLLVVGRDEQTGQEQVEIIHDALLPRWAMLRNWIAEDREFLLWCQRLDERLQEWQEKGKDRGSLLRGASLAEAERWLADRATDLKQIEQTYIQEGVNLREQERQAQEQLRYRTIIGAAVAGLIIVIMLAVFAWVQRNQAITQFNLAGTAVAAEATSNARREEAEIAKITAEIQRQDSVALQLAAQSELVRQQTTFLLPQSLLLAVESLKRNPTAQSSRALTEALLLYPQLIISGPPHQWGPDDIFSPNRKWVASRSIENTLEIWDIEGGNTIAQLVHSEKEVNSMAFSPDGNLIASIGNCRYATECWPSIYVWQTSSGQQIAKASISIDYIEDIVFSPDGTKLAVIGHCSNENPCSKRLLIWQFRTGNKPVQVIIEDEKTSEFRYKSSTFDFNGKHIILIGENFDPNQSQGSQIISTITSIREAETGLEVKRLEDEHGTGVIVSPNNKFIASANISGKVIIWDSSSGEELGVFDHDHSIKVASFSADSRLLVTMGQNSAYIWNFLNEQEPLKLDHDDIVTAVTFDANNDFLATTKQDRIVTIWDAHSGKELSQILLDGWARYSTFSPDNKLIAIVEQNSSSPSQYFPDTTRIWDIISGKEVYRIAHNGFVSKVEFNRPGTLIYAADRANQPGGISRFNVWRLSHQDQVEINFTTNQTYLTSRTFTPNSKRLILSGNCFPNDSCTSSLYVWNISDEHSVNQLTTSKGLIRGVALEPNSLLIGWVEICSSGSCPITTHIWSLSNTQEVAQLEHHQRNPDNLLIKFSSDGERLISAGVCDRYEQNCFTEIYIWNIITNSEVAHFREMQGRTVEISNKGNLVALGKENGDITIWETQNGHKSYQLTHGGEVSKLAFSQNEQFLASANHCPGVMPCLTTIKIWELGNKHETGQLTYFDPGERSGSVGESFVEFSPDGKWLILGRPNLVIMWDFETREKVLELNLAQGNHFKGQIPKVVFSPDGKRLAIGYKDRVVRVLDVQTRKEISRVLHSDAVSTLAFSPDGNWIVSGEHCIDTCPATVRIWNVETGKEIKQIIHNDTISSAYFSPDGKFLVSSGGNNLKLSLWHPDDLIKMACKRLNRNLTQAEWAQFLPNDKYELTCPNLGEPKE